PVVSRRRAARRARSRSARRPGRSAASRRTRGGAGRAGARRGRHGGGAGRRDRAMSGEAIRSGLGRASGPGDGRRRRGVVKTSVTSRPKAPGVPAQILVVDDDRRVRELLEIALAAHGFTVTTAADGEEAVKRALNERPDLVVLDVR